MLHRSHLTHGTASVVLALMLSAGAASPVLAGTGRALEATAAKGASTLSLDGLVFRTTGARISNQVLHTFSGSRTVLVTWDETTGRGTVGYSALSLDGNRFNQVMETGRDLRLRYARFDPHAGTPAVPPELKAGAANELYIVQFMATPLDEMRAQIAAAGGVVERYLPDNAHVVRMGAQAKAAVVGMPFVRFVGVYEPAYRLSTDVMADALSGGTAAVRYSIECMRSGPAQQQAVADLIRGMGGVVDVMIPDQYRLEASLTPAQLLVVAQLNEVNYIDGSGGPYGQDMDIVRQVGGAVPLLSGLGYQGQGVRGEVFDGGALSNHQQWNGQAPLVRTNNASDSHGTACYGINFATGTGNAQATGLLPMREQGIISRYQDTNQAGLGSGSFTRLSLNTAAVDPNGPVRSVFQSSSVGSPRITTYSTVSAEVDDYLFRVDYLSCQSQSNSGNRDSRPQAWAKNIVSVGGMVLQETVNRLDDIWASGASIGPADDLRVKPDLSHAFNNVFTTYTTSTTGYGQFSGTSSATPCTSGHFGLLMQMWHEGVWQGFGGGSSVFSDRPKSTTAKALMINGAFRNVANGTNRLYRGYVGWGMADLGNLYGIRNKTFIVNETDVLLNGQTKSYDLNVAAGEPEFRATMIFSDPQGNPAAAQDRINDLTLKVTAPDNTVYWGNNGMVATAISGPGQIAGANFSTPGGSANTVDTVENVFVQNPMAGVWHVEVIATQLVQDARLETPGVTDADFALVVAGVTAGQACYANCDGSTVVPILNVNDFTCFLNKYSAGDSYANCDGSTVVPILNVNDFTCFLNQYSAGCP